MSWRGCLCSPGNGSGGAGGARAAPTRARAEGSSCRDETTTQKIRDALKQRFAADELQDHEIEVTTTGDIMLDRRRKYPWAKPGRMARWEQTDTGIRITEDWA